MLGLRLTRKASEDPSADELSSESSSRPVFVPLTTKGVPATNDFCCTPGTAKGGRPTEACCWLPGPPSEFVCWFIQYDR